MQNVFILIHVKMTNLSLPKILGFASTWNTWLIWPENAKRVDVKNIIYSYQFFFFFCRMKVHLNSCIFCKVCYQTGILLKYCVLNWKGWKYQNHSQIFVIISFLELNVFFISLTITCRIFPRLLKTIFEAKRGFI